MPVFEADVCVIGAGISSAMLAEKLSELRPGLAITVVEAGSGLFDVASRVRARQRALDYGENPWPGDLLEDQAGAEGLTALTMAVGGLALRWGGRVQSVLGRGLSPQVHVRPRRGLGPVVRGSRAVLRRGRAAAERLRRSQSVPGGRPIAALSGACAQAVLQPAAAQRHRGAERGAVRTVADGPQPQALRRPRRLLCLRHLRRSVPDRS